MRPNSPQPSLPRLLSRRGRLGLAAPPGHAGPGSPITFVRQRRLPLPPPLPRPSRGAEPGPEADAEVRSEPPPPPPRARPGPRSRRSLTGRSGGRGGHGGGAGPGLKRERRRERVQGRAGTKAAAGAGPGTDTPPAPIGGCYRRACRSLGARTRPPARPRLPYPRHQGRSLDSRMAWLQGRDHAPSRLHLSRS